MTRSSGVFDSSPVQRRRRPVTLDEVADSGLYLGSRKACRVSDFANEDTDDIRSKSYNKDRALLDDITNKLCRLEFDNVKIGKDVGMKTGFRRHLYGKKRAPIEKETREQRRLDRLKHPWDYTNTNNYFRPKRPEPKTKKEKAEAKEREKRRPLWLKSERKEPTKPADPYPEYDPLGLYRKREKKKRSDTEGSLTASKYEDMNPREMLANVRAKVESMPRRRDAMRDIDSLLEDVVNKPLPRSHVSEYKVLNDDDQVDPNWEYTADPGLDDRMKSKISASRGELEQFERMLDSKFGRRGQKKPAGAGAGPFYYEVPALKAPSMVPAKVDMAKGIAALERELGIADDLYVEPIPTPVHHMRQPVVVKARTNARAGYGRPRTGSLPPPDRVGRAKLQSDIEVDNLALFSDDE